MSEAGLRCRDCGVALAPEMLACPSCQWLVHGERLKAIALEAERHEAGGDPSAALALWRELLTLLPEQSGQFRTVRDRAERLSQRIAAEPPPVASPPPLAWAKRLGPFGVVALLLWKLKFLLIGLLSKGKLLLLGLTKASTLFSMLLSMGAYWSLYGWRFALGLVASIYVHEMGHVAAIRRFGLPASAPMFIPGFGAMVRLQARPTTPVEDARIGLAGPLWGLGAAAVEFAIGRATGSPTWLAIAHAAAWINLFNLLPVWQLDGARGFAALARPGRALVAGAFAGVWLLGHDGLCLLLALAAGARAFAHEAPPRGDRFTLAQFLLLIGALGLLAAGQSSFSGSADHGLSGV
jgi:Zn-dependent protease